MRYHYLYSLACAASVNFGDLIDTIIGTTGIIDEHQSQRLIERKGGVRQWVTDEELFELLRDDEKFFDVTEHQDPIVMLQETVEFPKECHHKEEILEIAKTLDKQNLNTTLDTLTSFYTRYCKSEFGLNSSLWLYDYVSSLAQKRDDITVELFHHSWLQKSLIASFKGSKHPENIVVVGAHQDSTNFVKPETSPAPGADDDGSGTVTILEVFRALAQSDFKPENTLEFHWYSAEEIGLLGSQDIFNLYAERHAKVKAMLQQDMTGYASGKGKNGGPAELAINVDFVDDALTDFVRLVVDEYCDIGYQERECGYACSDHASASRHGYPSAYVFEAGYGHGNPYVHTVDDTIEHIDFDHMLQHCKLTLGYAYELSFAPF